MSKDPYSYVKIFHHADKLKAMQEKRVTPPIYVRIKPINLCNHHCFYCSYDDQELGLRSTFNVKDKIPWPKMEEIVHDFGDMGVKAVTFSGGGEPLIYPYIEDTMQMILDKGIDLSIITHGEFLKERKAELLSQARWVRISMDSCEEQAYCEIRSVKPKNFQAVVENLQNFGRNKPAQCELGINFVINHLNASQVYDMAKFVKDAGANHIKYAARITDNLFEYHQPFKEQVIEQIRRAENELAEPGFQVINKYEGDFDLAMVYERTYTHCPIIQSLTVIGADSKVYLCHDKAYVPGGDLGSLKDQSFKDLWMSEKTREFFENFNPMESCKHHCTYDERNIMINSVLNLEQDHVNFI